MLKIAVIGVGNISASHIDAWNAIENAEIIALCDIRPEQMDRYEGMNKYTDFEELLRCEKPDIVDICLPTFLHADYAVKALEHGINVVCEKPISLKKEDVKRVYDTAERHGVRFMVAQVRRFWPEFEFVHELYEKGTYGKLLSGAMTRLGNCPQWSWDNWMRDEARSGLVPFDLHIHDLDFVVYTFGAPKNASCHRARRPEQDYFSVTYEFDDFFITAESAWYNAPYPFKASFRFQFENAVVAYENDKLTVYECSGNIMEQSGDNNAVFLNGNAFKNELSYFASCVEQGRPAEKVKAHELETVIDILRAL